MSEIDMSDGPLELIDMNQTKQYLIKKKNIEEAKKTYFVGGLGDVFLCKLNVCLHILRFLLKIIFFKIAKLLRKVVSL